MSTTIPGASAALPPAAHVLRAAEIAEKATKAIYPAILAAVLEALRAADQAKGGAA